MAFQTLFIDGFDHYVTANLATKWSNISGSASWWNISTTTVRNGSQALAITSGYNNSYHLRRTLGGQYRTLVIGCALYLPTGITRGIGPFALWANGTKQLSVVLNTALKLEVRRGDYNGTLLGTGATVLPATQWIYVEFRAYIDDTAGEWEIRVNGITDASGTGVDTKNTTDNFADEVGLGIFDQGTCYVDDFYVRGDTALSAGGHLGDCKVLTRYPQGPGTYSQLTSSSGGANWTNVDEATPNTTDYNSTNVTGNKDTYDFAALADSGAIKAVQLNLYANKSDAGTRSIEHYVKSGATEQAGSPQALSTSYAYKTKTWDTDPATSAAWTASGLDTAEFGTRAAA